MGGDNALTLDTRSTGFIVVACSCSNLPSDCPKGGSCDNCSGFRSLGGSSGGDGAVSDSFS